MAHTGLCETITVTVRLIYLPDVNVPLRKSDVEKPATDYGDLWE